MKNLDDKKDGINVTNKVLLFFFGILFVIIVGNQYFYNMPGTKRQKKELLICYYVGILFWCVVLGILFYFFD